MANITPKAAGKRSPKVWFDDGNVLLRAQDTLFRVYRGILGRESAVFRDMFALPQPANGEEVDEEWGCPVVHAQDDVEEMELFLTAVFVPRLFYDEFGLREHTILLAICSKYQAVLILRRVVATLEHFYPSTLSAIDHVWHVHRRGFGTCTAFPSNHPLARHEMNKDDALLLMRTLRRADILIFLPAAMVFLSQGELADKIVEYEDWPRSDLRLLVRCRLHLDNDARERIFPLLYSTHTPISPGCRDPTVCPLIRTGHMRSCGTFCLPQSAFEPLDTAGFCTSCAEAIENMYLVERGTTWNGLPRLLDLPSWNELLASRDAALAFA